MIILQIVEMILFILLSLNVIYLLIFVIASFFSTDSLVKEPNKHKRIAVLIPAYKEDSVIMECVNACLLQQYPKDCYEVVVISDQMDAETNTQLSLLSLKLIPVCFENSTKSKALNYAMEQLGDGFDLTLILDADNIISPDFLSQLNDAFAVDGVEIVQAHRCAKNLNTPLACLDAASEEINNTIFRKGHAVLGFSAALIGSGMCFKYDLFKHTMLSITAIGGFDRALELSLLRKGHRISYLPYADVLDEKVQHSKIFSSQRRRWLSAQYHYSSVSFKDLWSGICEKKWDFCDKYMQQITLPRLMLVGIIVVIALLTLFINPLASIKWWILFGLLLLTLLLAVPRYLLTKKLFYALFQLPYYTILMFLAVFKLKGANKKFIHTSHGVKK